MTCGIQMLVRKTPKHICILMLGHGDPVQPKTTKLCQSMSYTAVRLCLTRCTCWSSRQSSSRKPLRRFFQETKNHNIQPWKPRLLLVREFAGCRLTSTCWTSTKSPNWSLTMIVTPLPRKSTTSGTTVCTMTISACLSILILAKRPRDGRSMTGMLTKRSIPNLKTSFSTSMKASRQSSSSSVSSSARATTVLLSSPTKTKSNVHSWQLQFDGTHHRCVPSFHPHQSWWWWCDLLFQ